jgi:hypothetical protein
MMKTKRVSTGPDVKETYDRMVSIVGLITPTSAPVDIEYSALMCAAALVMTSAHGLEPTEENCSAVLQMIADEVIPAIEAKVMAL